MSIDFSGGNIGMSEQGLYRSQVRAIGQQMSGKGVAQGMRGYAVWCQTGLVGKSFNQSKKPVPREMAQFTMRWKQKP